MRNFTDLTGRKAIVTGGTRGLGRGMAEGLMEAGAEVGIVGSSDKVYTVAEEFVKNGFQCYGVVANLGDAQARRLKIRIKNGKEKYFAHTLNNTVVAPPRMLIAFLENNLNEDGSVNVPEALRPYMGGKEKLVPKH